MAGDRIAQALARIEAATGRIEVAARRPSPATSGDEGKFARKYEALRSEAAAAVAELDRLLASLDR